MKRFIIIFGLLSSLSGLAAAGEPAGNTDVKLAMAKQSQENTAAKKGEVGQLEAEQLVQRKNVAIRKQLDNQLNAAFTARLKQADF